MQRRSIPQRELRNDIARVLREAEAGAEFTITVRGRPVARLGPAAERRVDVDRDSLRALLADTPVDKALADDLAALRTDEEPAGDPWNEG
jgi:prevent-host-death family protein